MENLIQPTIIDGFLKFWEALSLLFQQWLLSPKPFLSTAAKLQLIPSMAVLVFGLFAASFGARSIPFRITAVLPGLLLGWFLGGWIASATGFSAQILAYGLAIGLAILGGFSPVSLFSIPIALLGSIFAYELAGTFVRAGDFDSMGWFISIIAGLGLTGVIALIADKITTGISCAFVGAAASVMGFVGMAKSLGIRNSIIDHPYFVSAAIGLVFIASAIIHFHYLFTEEERAQAKSEKATEKAKAKEDKERLKRFENYGKPSKKPSRKF